VLLHIFTVATWQQVKHESKGTSVKCSSVLIQLKCATLRSALGKLRRNYLIKNWTMNGASQGTMIVAMQFETKLFDWNWKISCF